MIMQVNADDVQREMLEAQRKYREQYASQYSAGYTDAEEKLNPIIEDLQSQNSNLQSQNSDLQSQNSNLQKLLDDYKNKYGDIQ